jgi:uncharacterized protein YcbK (DUF882 family)
MSAALLRRRCVLGAIVSLAATRSACAAFHPPAAATRRLRLFNPHTGETFDGPYSTQYGVIPGAAAELSHFLRDFHSGVTATIDMRTIDFLWDVLHSVGARGATVLSAYRTPETNAMLARTNFGVAEHSQHMFARAIDFTLGSGLPEAVAVARAMRRGGVGWYPRSRFIHIDTGPVRTWELGDPNLRQLLNHPDEQLRIAAGSAGSASVPRHGPGETGAPAVSQYARTGTAADPTRASQYSADGISNRVIRPSQYAGTS